MSEYDDDGYDGDDDDRSDEYYEDIVDREYDDRDEPDELPDYLEHDSELLDLYEDEGFDWLDDVDVYEVELGADYP